ncbi:sensor histidine kinase [Bacteroidota bacterium]
MQKVYNIIITSSIISLLLFIFLFFSDTGQFPSIKLYFEIYIWAIIIGNCSGFILYIISRWLNKKIPWNIGFGKRFFSGLFLNLIVTSLITLLIFVIYFILPISRVNISDFYSDHFDTILKGLILIFTIVMFYTLADFSMYSYVQFAKGQVENAKLKRTQLNLQFDALKSQLSPHYLFNSLNTISSLIYRDIKIAEEFIRKLAITYQYILEKYERNLITLSEELEIVNAYKFLMEIRFEKAFILTVNLPESLNSSKIPSLSIQMLVENAIKHNAISIENPIKVEISHESNYIVVTNNLSPKPYYVNVENNLIQNPIYTKSHKIGLENIKKRYSLYTNRSIQISKNEKFIVKLPVLQLNNYEESLISNDKIFGFSQKDRLKQVIESD